MRNRRSFNVFCSLILTAAISLSSAIPSFAAETEVDEQNIVYSEQFPDAYIITETYNEPSTLSDDEFSFPTVKATVFVEETYKNVDGELTVTDSRLLSKDEVLEIGEENFDELAAPIPLGDTSGVNTGTAAVSERGKLTLIFSGRCSTSNGIEPSFSATATWSGFNSFLQNDGPAIGNDFMGLTWGGNFSVKSSQCTAYTQLNSNINTYLSSANPTVGRVWEFQEYFGGNYALYAQYAYIFATLHKNYATGSGNTTEAVLQYTHTYQQVTGSISIDTSGIGFTLSQTPKQWSVACVINNIPY